MDALCRLVTGQSLTVVAHQVEAIRSNVWSWVLTSLGLRDRVRLQLQADHVAVRPGHEGSASRGGAGETRGEATDE